MNKLFRKVWAALLAVCLMAGVAVMPASAAEAGQSFSDVPTTSYYYKSVEWAVSEGITVGTGGGKFSPDVTCTVEQIITFIWRANGSPATSAGCSFIGVKPDSPYYTALAWANEHQIVSSEMKATTDPCTRAMAVLYLWRAGGCAEPTITVNFSDVPSDAVYAKAVAWALENGITAGTGGSNFSPNQTCTRGQIVTLLYRNLVEGVEVKLPEAGDKPTTTAKGMAYYGLEPTAKLNVPYSITTTCNKDPSKHSTGTVTFTSYTRTDNGDGYETVTVGISVIFGDENGWKYGANSWGGMSDYYLYEDYGEYADLRDGNHNTYSMEWNGRVYGKCGTGLSAKASLDKELKKSILIVNYTAIVPNGYDGIVVWIAENPASGEVPAAHLRDFNNLIMFRCN